MTLLGRAPAEQEEVDALWDFPSASLNSGTKTPNYIASFVSVSRQLAFPGGPITLFLVSSLSFI